MKFLNKKPPKKCDYDIHRNPNNPGNSRIPVDESYEALLNFLKNEIEATKICACPCCDYRRHMLRGLEYTLREWHKMKIGQYNMCQCCKEVRKGR